MRRGCHAIARNDTRDKTKTKPFIAFALPKLNKLKNNITAIFFMTLVFIIKRDAKRVPNYALNIFKQ